MVLSFEEQKELEHIKQENKKEILRLTNANTRNAHQWRMTELNEEQKIVRMQLGMADLGTMGVAT